MRLLPNLAGRKSCGPYTEPHDSVRLIELCQQIVGVYELAAIRLRHRLEEESFLVGSDTKRFAVAVTQDRDLFTFRERLPFDDDCSARHSAGSDLHIGILPFDDHGPRVPASTKLRPT